MRITAILLGLFLSFSLSASATPKHPLGLKLPVGWERSAPFKRVHPPKGVKLPDHFSLADKWGKLPGHRDQGQCGSCFAHSATEPLRLAYFWKTGVDLDVAVQETLSCARAGTCEDGGYPPEAIEWLKGGVAKEGDFPYAGEDLPCKAGLSHIAHYTSWHFIGENPEVGPRADDIKAALMTGVSVPVTVSVENNFQEYRGGLFGGRLCKGRSPNHAVQLVGWKTVGRKTYWQLRNSWGDSWGDHGDMWIAQNCSLVGGLAIKVDVE